MAHGSDPTSIVWKLVISSFFYIRSHFPEDLVIQIASISQALGICFTRLGGFKYLLNVRPETHPGVSWYILTFAYDFHSWVETQPPTNCYNQLAGLHSPNISLVPKMEGFLNLKFSAISGVEKLPLHKLYIHTAYIGEDASILGTWNVWWLIIVFTQFATRWAP